MLYLQLFNLFFVFIQFYLPILLTFLISLNVLINQVINIVDAFFLQQVYIVKPACNSFILVQDLSKTSLHLAFK